MKSFKISHFVIAVSLTAIVHLVERRGESMLVGAMCVYVS